MTAPVTPEEAWDAQLCHAFNVFNNVGCTRSEGHSGTHLHDYGNGYVCGWRDTEGGDDHAAE